MEYWHRHRNVVGNASKYHHLKHRVIDKYTSGVPDLQVIIGF